MAFAEHRIVGGIGADDGFWQGLEDGEFRLSRCSSCKNWVWPAHYRCGECGSWELDWVAVPPHGIVYSWTRSWYAFDRVREHSDDIPYVTVLAEIPHAGSVRVLGMLQGDEAGLRCGARVSGIICPPTAKSKNYPSIQWRLEP